MEAKSGFSRMSSSQPLAWALLLIAVVQLSVVAPAAAKPPAGSVSPVAPAQERIQAIVQEAYDKFKGDTRGKNADYIPELGRVDSKLFGIAVVRTDNQSVAVGDVKTSFSIQSIAKVFSLALAMEEHGADKVFEKIFTTDAYGGLAGEFPLPKGTMLGNYSLQVLYPDGMRGVGGSSFRVEKIKD